MGYSYCKLNFSLTTYSGINLIIPAYIVIK